VTEDFDKAHRLFTSAALQGFNEAMFNLGVMHAQGQSVEPDTGVAYAWFSVANDYGNPNAAEVMTSIEAEATDEQKKELKKVAKELKEQIDEIVENAAKAAE
jgi:TPR repeat protein